MRRCFSFLFIFFLVAGSAAGADISGSLCLPGENVMFSCQIGEKVVSLCATADLSVDTGCLTYRFGRPGREPELTYPSKPTHPKDAFCYAYSGYSKGSTQELAFDIGDYTYTVHIDNHAFRGSASGIVIEKNGKRVAYLKCNVPDPNDRLYELTKKGMTVHEPRHLGTPPP